ncbi:hypothetical protein [Aequorivita echinoideorum]|uniref:Uncharacterized protein n=1 Tax=Aequorivita echinoideorum TaxID=1549647 RepID=A0ABS5S261_9FLAO|nr:hypothetical protein [Aequorivita echinoideorum]MBT0607294.1 hypothetical protein [Aequorivita echinoideorum]
MGQKEDIGKLFESKLSQGKKAPSNMLWEKIDTTLDEQDQRRKRVIVYWLLGSVILVFLTGFFIFNFGMDNSNPQNSQNETEVPLENNISTESEKLEQMDSEKDSLENSSEIIISKRELISSETKFENEEIKAQKNESKSAKYSSEKNAIRKMIDEDFTVSKKYYYYDSKSGKQIVTTSKAGMDSIVAAATKSIDSAQTQNLDVPQ